MSSKFKPNTTQTPNVLFDRLMYELPDAEFKVLCAIVRKTYGWHKDSDRIANSQFEAMTGKEKRQIQRAKASLKAKGLIRETLPDRRDGIAEYEFIEPDPVSQATPPHDMHDAQGVTQETHTKDTKQKTLNKRQDTAPNGEQVNLLLNIIYREINYSLYKDYKLRKIIDNALKSHSFEYLETCLCGYLQDKWAKDNNVWNFYKFFSEQLQMEKYKAKGRERIGNAAQSPAGGFKSTLPDFSHIKLDDAPIDEEAWQTLTGSKK